jgi:NAD(P)-dependent dehydrogenase (short-subunit alcohol dehydrogenase family)
MELDLLSFESVAKFAKAFNARQAPLHALINNAGIFSIGGMQNPYYLLNSVVLCDLSDVV